MGLKNLKAIAVGSTRAPPLFAKDAFEEAVRATDRDTSLAWKMSSF